MKKCSLIFLLLITLVSCSSLPTFDIGSREYSSRSDLTCHGLLRFFTSQEDDVPKMLRKLPLEELDDSAMEIELKRSKEVLKLLDTEDGSLAPLFRNAQMPEGIELPAEIKQRILDKGFAHSRADMMDIRFSDLDYNTQVKILKFQGANRLGDFFSNRTVPGLKMRTTVTMTFDKKTRFLGTLYQPGTHDIDISNLIEKNIVEYKGPQSVTNFGGVEIHLRTGKLASGDLSMDAWKFLKGAGIPKDRGHVHVVTKMNLDALKENIEVQAPLMTDFWRRVNMVGEFLSVIDKGVSIREVSGNGAIYFQPTGSEQIGATYQFLRSLGNASDWRSVSFGDRAKMGYVGFHGPDKYDADVPVWGFQFRTVSGKKKVTFRDYLNIVQKQMKNHEFGSVDESRIQAWLGERLQNSSQTGMALQKAWAHRSQYELLDTMSSDLRPLFDNQAFKSLFFESSSKNKELDYLIHNWADDPLLFDNPEAISKVVEAQKNALAKIVPGVDDAGLKEAVQTFLEESDLYKIFLGSIGG